MANRSCSIVLIGENTAGRKYISYEIEETWKSKMGLVGIYIHGLKDSSGGTARKGENPFDRFNIGSEKLSSIVKCYEPQGYSSHDKYNHIADK